MRYIPQVKPITPSQVYQGETGTSLSAYIFTNHIQIEAFRPPRIGDSYIPRSGNGCFEGVRECVSNFEEDVPRFIVRTSKPLPDQTLCWE